LDGQGREPQPVKAKNAPADQPAGRFRHYRPTDRTHTVSLGPNQNLVRHAIRNSKSFNLAEAKPLY
jgi:hypothetical protein